MVTIITDIITITIIMEVWVTLLCIVIMAMVTMVTIITDITMVITIMDTEAIADVGKIKSPRKWGFYYSSLFGLSSAIVSIAIASPVIRITSLSIFLNS